MHKNGFFKFLFHTGEYSHIIIICRYLNKFIYFELMNGHLWFYPPNRPKQIFPVGMHTKWLIDFFSPFLEQVEYIFAFYTSYTSGPSFWRRCPPKQRTVYLTVRGQSWRRQKRAANKRLQQQVDKGFQYYCNQLKTVTDIWNPLEYNLKTL